MMMIATTFTQWVTRTIQWWRFLVNYCLFHADCEKKSIEHYRLPADRGLPMAAGNRNLAFETTAGHARG
jgi:hypothetical protein